MHIFIFITETVGPLLVSINDTPLQSYKKGILNPQNCPMTNPTRTVLLVGYGSENGVNYWILKNSKGSGFGENGYFRLVRNGKNTCGILSWVFYPRVN